MGISIPIPEEKTFHIWKENLKAFEVYQLCQTQWNSSFGGVTGLNYPGVQVVIKTLGYKLKILLDVQHIERGALEAIKNGRQKV